MRRYELREGQSCFFWEIEFFAHHFDIREGAGGTVTRSKQWDFRTPGRARSEYRKHVDWRERAGFALVHSDAADDDIVSLAVAELRGDVNLELEAAIREQPDTPDAWLVYGDWLESQGSERGELVQVQAVLATRPDDVALREREEALLADHERAWLGDLADSHSSMFRCTWKYGFLERVELSSDLFDLQSAFQTLGSVAAARLLRVLQVQILGGGEALEITSLLTPHPILRELTLDSSLDLAFQDAEGTSRPLEVLTLRGQRVRIASASLPALRSLALTFGALEVDDEKLIAPALEVLSVTFYGAEEDTAIAGPLAPFVRSLLERAPRVHSLTMRVPSWGDELVTMLADHAALVPGLQIVDLSGSDLTDAGAATLLAHARAFQHVHFDLRYNRLGAHRASELSQRFDHVQLEGQNEVPPWRRTQYDDIDE